jgi:hypothetical protein
MTCWLCAWIAPRERERQMWKSWGNDSIKRV